MVFFLFFLALLILFIFFNVIKEKIEDYKTIKTRFATTCQGLEKEKKELISKCQSLEKKLDDKNKELHSLENEKNFLEIKYNEQYKEYGYNG